MDTALNVNGDFDTDDLGAAYRIFGTDEIVQKVYVLLSSRLGGFIYDRSLGSEIYNIDISLPEACDRIIAEARKVLCAVPVAEVVGADINDGKVSISVRINGKVYNILLRI